MKPWPKDAKAIICCRIDDPDYHYQPNSKQSQCWNCTNAVWMSPVTIAKAKEIAEGLVLCLNCYRAYFDASGLKYAEVPSDTPEQIAEQGYKRTWEGTILREKGQVD